MSQHRLRGIDAKLDRANKQLECLKAKWGAFLNQDESPHTIEFKHDAEAGLYLPTFLIDKEPPLELSVMCGEIVYDLRSALDHLAAELVEAHGSDPIRRIAFPIHSVEVEWINSVQFPKDRSGRSVRGPLHNLPKTSDAWAYVQLAQPYQRGQEASSHPLSQLNVLSNRDKHRVVSAMYLYPGLGVFDMFGWDFNAAFESGHAKLQPGDWLEHGTELAWFAFDPEGPDPKMRVKRRIPFEIAFGDPESDPGRESSLAELITRVEQIRRDCAVWTG